MVAKLDRWQNRMGIAMVLIVMAGALGLVGLRALIAGRPISSVVIPLLVALFLVWMSTKVPIHKDDYLDSHAKPAVLVLDQKEKAAVELLLPPMYKRIWPDWPTLPPARKEAVERFAKEYAWHAYCVRTNRAGSLAVDVAFNLFEKAHHEKAGEKSLFRLIKAIHREVQQSPSVH